MRQAWLAPKGKGKRMSTRCARERKRLRTACLIYWVLGIIAIASWAYVDIDRIAAGLSSSPRDTGPFLKLFGSAAVFAVIGKLLWNQALQWEPLTASQVMLLANIAEKNPRIADCLRERIETHGELVSRDFKTAWTMYESGLLSHAEIEAVKAKDADEKRLSAALRIKA